MDTRPLISRFTERDWETDETDGTVRFALVGLGWWTMDVVVPAIEQSDYCETTVLVSSSTEKAERLADENNVESGITYDEFHDGAAVEEYDAVYIGTPNAYHLDYVETAADLEKAVLCEKPLEATVERAEQLVEAAEDADIPLMTAYRMHTEPAVRRAKELIEDGFIGEPTHVYGNNTQPILEMIPDPDQWRLDSDVTGYGTSVMDLGIYPINTARFLLERDPIAAEARMSSPDEAFDDVPDQYATVTLTLEGDLPLVCTTSQHAQKDTQLKIIGTEGTIELSPAFHGEATLSLSSGSLRTTIEDVEYTAVEEMREEFDYFADRVLNDGEILPDGRHGLADLRTIKGIHEAADRDERVDL
ncbi:D-xylose 1-dehydrogenase Gfo6 [Natronolimnobius baerhuensis]|uniref:Glucose-fructose oxidoreductase n=1 Tax=Natronolimnobius baerhuensis TaxID=253108 RepID=A0A202E8U9_9EURY|nr:D-xylose 1-dehydrogenase Gfo6 [Natronolimnobius baerhuensis]OVE84681.1 glucose-fructose oxidoreductase [Natronolimnobius baerhuensis]